MSLNKELNDVKAIIVSNKKELFTVALKKLNYILKVDPANDKALSYMAKLQYNLGNYELSICYYKKASKNDHSQSIYLGMFKSYVAIGDFNNANKSFNCYKSTLVKNTLNSELLDSILNAIITNGEVVNPVLSTDQYMYTAMNKLLEEPYKNLINAYNQRDYSTCKKITIELQKIVNQNNYAVEFYTLNKLFQQLLIIKSKEQDNLLKEVDKLIVEQDYDKLFIIYNQIINKPINNSTQLRLLTKILYKTHRDELIKLINSAKDNFPSNKAVLKKCINIIYELDEYNEISVEKKKLFEHILLEGKLCKMQNDYLTAYDWYSYGEYIFGTKTFIYHQARCLYECKKYKEALKLLNELEDYMIKYDKVKVLKNDIENRLYMKE